MKLHKRAMAAAAVCLAGSANAADLSVGQPFPFQSFPSMEAGSPLSVTQFQGKKTVLHIFASW
ncbi:MAG: hypothetical protein WD342_12920 [Verrucomicrobiales bacterium]